LRLQHSNIVAAVIADHRRKVGTAGTDIGDADTAGTGDHVIIGEHLSGWTQQDAGTGTRCVLVGQLGIDIHHTRLQR
jgi:hypothetical protein